MSLLDKLRRFMTGRYGFDALARFLFILSLVFWAIGAVLRATPLTHAYYVFWAINVAIYAFAVFRILSKDTWKRTLENERYLRLRGRFLPFFRGVKTRAADREHVFRRCRYCRAKLRLKRLRGRHTTRCPQCGRTFRVFIPF